MAYPLFKLCESVKLSPLELVLKLSAVGFAERYPRNLLYLQNFVDRAKLFKSKFLLKLSAVRQSTIPTIPELMLSKKLGNISARTV